MFGKSALQSSFLSLAWCYFHFSSEICRLVLSSFRNWHFLISIYVLRFWRNLSSLKQTYLQSTTTRLEEMRVKRRDAEQWMSHRLLPENLRERIRRYEQYKWQETRGVDEENLICNLPKDLRRDIKRHLCLALLMRVSLPTIIVFLISMHLYVNGVMVVLYCWWSWTILLVRFTSGLIHFQILTSNP